MQQKLQDFEKTYVDKETLTEENNDILGEYQRALERVSKEVGEVQNRNWEYESAQQGLISTVEEQD